MGVDDCIGALGSDVIDCPHVVGEVEWVGLAGQFVRDHALHEEGNAEDVETLANECREG